MIEAIIAVTAVSAISILSAGLYFLSRRTTVRLVDEEEGPAMIELTTTRSPAYESPIGVRPDSPGAQRGTVVSP